jgi:hypothetical protein
MSFTKIRTTNILSGTVGSGSLGVAAITGFPASTGADNSDLILIYDDSEEGLRKQTRSNFLGTIESIEIPTASIAFGQIDGAGASGDGNIQFLTGSSGFSGGLFFGDMQAIGPVSGPAPRANLKDGAIPRAGSGSVAFNVARVYLTASAQMSLETGGALTLSSSANAARAVQIGASGGTSATVHITSKGSGGNAIDINADGGLDIDVGSTVHIDAGGALSIDVVGSSNVTAKGALTVSGSTGLNLKSDSGAIDIDSRQGAVNIDAVGASNFTTNGALTISGSTGLNLKSDGGTIDMETRVGAIDIDAASTIDIDGAAGINIGKAADVAIDIDSAALDIDASGAITIDGTSTFSIDGVGASNVTTRGALTVSGSSTLDLRADSGDITVETRQGDVHVSGDTVLVMSGGAVLSPLGHGADTNFYVSGSVDSRGTAVKGTSVYGGDLLVSGAMYSILGVSGSLTRLTDGTSYLAAGAGISIASASNGQVVITNDGTVGDITSVTAGTGLSGGGGNGDVTLAINDSVVATISGSNFAGNVGVTGSIRSTLGYSGSLTRLLDGTSYLAAGSNVTITSASNGQVLIASADNNTEYTAGTGLILDSTEFSINDSVVATISGSNFAGNVGVTGSLGATLGFSGSLTRLTDGSSYLIAGSNVTITSASNGAVTIASSGGGGSSDGTNFFTSPAAGKINTTGSAVFAGGELGTSYVATTIGTDVFFFVSGTIGSKDIANTGSAVFGGDVVMSGSLHVPKLGVTGSVTGATTALEVDRDYAGTTSNSSLTSHAAASGILIDYDVTGDVGASQYQKHKALWIKYDQSAPTFNSAAIVQGTGIWVEMTGSTDGIQSVDGISVYVEDPGSLSGDAARGILINAPAGLVDGAVNGSHLRCVTQGATSDYFDISVGASGLTQLSTIDSSGANAHLNLKPDGIVTILSGGGITSPSESSYGDTNFFVSGTISSRGTSVKGTSVFGGDVVVSGALNAPRGLSGSLTRLVDGTSYLAAGSNVTITSASNGQVLIASADNNTEYTAGTGLILDSTEFKINDSLVATISGSNFAGNVGVTGSLAVTSNLSVGEYVSHLGDTDTSMRFESDKITFAAGGESLLTLTEATQDIVTVGDGGDVDFKVRTNNNDNTLFVQGNTDRVGIGLNGPATTLHLKDSDVTIRLQRDDNAEAGTIEFAGSGGAVGASIAHDVVGNDLVFDVFDGSAVEESLRLGGYGTSANRQVIILSGSTMHAGAMQPRQAADIAFFVSGTISSRGTSVKGTSVFGGDLVVSGNLNIDNFVVHPPTRIVFQSTGSILTFSSSMTYVSVDGTARQSGITANTYDLGVSPGLYEGQEVSIVYTGSLLPQYEKYALFSGYGSGDYVSQLRVGFPGATAQLILAFATADPSAINGKTLGLIDAAGVLYSFTGSSSTAPASPSFTASGKSTTFGVNGISSTDEAAAGLATGIALAAFNSLGMTAGTAGGGSGRLVVQQLAAGSSGNTSITGTAITDGVIGDIGGTNAFAAGANQPNALNVNYTNVGITGGAFINYKSPALRMVWDAAAVQWNVITDNGTSL